MYEGDAPGFEIGGDARDHRDLEKGKGGVHNALASDISDSAAGETWEGGDTHGSGEELEASVEIEVLCLEKVAAGGLA